MTNIVTGYELRTIDANGDSTDCDFYRFREGAEHAVQGLTLPSPWGDVAWVIEQVIEKTYANGRNKRTHKVVAFAGDPNALKAGGWIK